MVKKKAQQISVKEGRRLYVKHSAASTTRASKAKNEHQPTTTKSQRLRDQEEEKDQHHAAEDMSDVDNGSGRDGSGEESEAQSSESEHMPQKLHDKMRKQSAVTVATTATKPIDKQKDRSKYSKKGDYIYQAIMMMKGKNNHIHQLDQLIQERFQEHLDDYRKLCEMSCQRKAIVKRIGKIRNYWKEKNGSERGQPTAIQVQPPAASIQQQPPPPQHINHIEKASILQSKVDLSMDGQSDGDEEQLAEAFETRGGAAAADYIDEEDDKSHYDRTVSEKEEETQSKRYMPAQSHSQRDVSLRRENPRVYVAPSKQQEDSYEAPTKSKQEILQELAASNSALEQMTKELGTTHGKLNEYTQVQKDLLENNKTLNRRYDILSNQFNTLTTQLQAMTQMYERNSQNVLAQLRQQEELIRKSKPSSEEQKQVTEADSNMDIDDDTIEDDAPTSHNGLSRTLYNALIQDKLEEYTDSCGCCKAPLKQKQRVITLFCNPLHRLHLKCAKLHFLMSSSCPVCQMVLSQRIKQHISKQEEAQSASASRMRDISPPRSQIQYQQPLQRQSISHMRSQPQMQVHLPATIHTTSVQPNPQTVNLLSATTNTQSLATTTPRQAVKPLKAESLSNLTNLEEMLSPIKRPVPISPMRMSPMSSPKPVGPSAVRTSQAVETLLPPSSSKPSAQEQMLISAFRKINPRQKINDVASQPAFEQLTAECFFQSREPTAVTAASATATATATVTVTSAACLQSSRTASPLRSSASSSRESMVDISSRDGTQEEKKHQLFAASEDKKQEIVVPALYYDSDPLTESDDDPADDKCDEQYSIDYYDRQTVRSGKKLNDQVIDAFAILLKKQMVLQNKNDVYPLSVSAFRQLLGQTPLKRPFLQAIDMEAKTILFPTNLDSVHWGLVVVYVDEHLAYIVDSMLVGEDSSPATNMKPLFSYDKVLEGVKFAMLCFYTMRYERSSNKQIKTNAKQLASSDVDTLMENLSTIQFAAQQKNDYDCGVFVCINMMILCQNSGDTSGLIFQNDNETMKVLRKYLRHDIVSWKKRGRLWDKFIELNSTQNRTIRNLAVSASATPMNHTPTAGASAAATTVPTMNATPAPPSSGSKITQSVHQALRLATTNGSASQQSKKKKQEVPQRETKAVPPARSHFEMSFRKPESSDDERIVPCASHLVNISRQFGATARAQKQGQASNVITPNSSSLSKMAYKDVPHQSSSSKLLLKKMMGGASGRISNSDKSSSLSEDDNISPLTPGKVLSNPILKKFPGYMKNSSKSKSKNKRKQR